MSERERTRVATDRRDRPPRDERGDDDGHEPGDQEGEFDALTRLYIRTHPADDGSEPLPAGLEFWTSPDVVVVRPGGAVGGEAVPLQENRVRVTVTNGGGIPAVDAWVDAFVSEPTPVLTPASARLIGGTSVTVQAYQQATVELPWIPEAGDSGHRCLVARVSLVVPPDTFDDLLVFDVVGDRHVAQRNIQVLGVPVGATMTFLFRVRAAEGQEEVLVHAVERTADLTTEELVRAGGCEGGLPALVPLAGLGVRLLDAREAVGRPTLSGTAAPPLGVARRPEQVPDRDEVHARLDGRVPATGAVTFEVAGDDEPGRLHAVDVVQLDGRTGEPAGGLRFVVRVS